MYNSETTVQELLFTIITEIYSFNMNLYTFVIDPDPSLALTFVP